MAKITYKKELEHLASYISRVSEHMADICGQTIYVMADIVADKIRENINSLHYVSDAEGLKRYRMGAVAELTYSEKKGLQEGFGISSLQNDRGYMNVRLGFDGYNGVVTRKYPKGQPNAMIARAIESGSSVRAKRPFVRPAVRAAQAEAVKKGEQTAIEAIQKLG